jgi:hypothetical protein
VVVIFAGPITVAELKDQRFLASFGWWTFGGDLVIGAFRLARPESWWARHLYGRRKKARAEDRYAEDEWS